MAKRKGNLRSTASESSFESAKKTAYQSLARRDRTSSEIAKKLNEKGFSEKDISDVISFLKEMDLLNDVRFARQWVAFRIEQHHYGPMRLRQELLSKGLLASEVDLLIDQLKIERDWMALAECALRQRYRDMDLLQDKKNRRRAFDYLRRKGHATENIATVFRKIGLNIF